MYFHGSRKHFNNGFILRPKKDGYLYQESIEFEKYIESKRPEGKLSRFNSVFVSRDPGLIDAAGGYTDAIYTVIPKSTPEPSDLAWYSDAYIEFESKRYGGSYSQSKLDFYIEKYWSGDPYAIKENSNFEYRTSSAVVELLYELNVDALDELETVEKECSLSCELG